jgi:hypothetical protein
MCRHMVVDAVLHIWTPSSMYSRGPVGGQGYRGKGGWPVSEAHVSAHLDSHIAPSRIPQRVLAGLLHVGSRRALDFEQLVSHSVKSDPLGTVDFDSTLFQQVDGCAP